MENNSWPGLYVDFGISEVTGLSKPGGTGAERETALYMDAALLCMSHESHMFLVFKKEKIAKAGTPTQRTFWAGESSYKDPYKTGDPY